MMKRLILLFLLLSVPVQPPAAADTTDDDAAEANDYATLESNLTLITKYLDKMSSLFQKKPKRKEEAVRQVKKAEAYAKSAAGKKAYLLITEGFPCPPEDEISPATAKKINKTLRSMEKFRKTLALWHQCVNEVFTNCEAQSAEGMYIEEEFSPILSIADSYYESLYETLHESDRQIPQFDDYKK